jgi:hypothetical protein
MQPNCLARRAAGHPSAEGFDLSGVEREEG